MYRCTDFCCFKSCRPLGMRGSHLLYEVHTFRRLHSVCVVNYMRDAVFGAHSSQLFNPAGHNNKHGVTAAFKYCMVDFTEVLYIYITCRALAGRSRRLSNEHTGCFRLQVPQSCARLLPGLSAAHRLRGHSPPRRAQTLKMRNIIIISHIRDSP